MARCWYRDCPNVRISLSGKLVFFSLPNADRRALWVERCGHQPEDNRPKIVNRVVCEKHFEEHHIRRQFYRTTLRSDAVPIQWKPAANQQKQTSTEQHQTTSVTAVVDESRRPTARHHHHQLQIELNLPSSSALEIVQHDEEYYVEELEDDDEEHQAGSDSDSSDSESESEEEEFNHHVDYNGGAAHADTGDNEDCKQEHHSEDTNPMDTEGDVKLCSSTTDAHTAMATTVKDVKSDPATSTNKTHHDGNHHQQPSATTASTIPPEPDYPCAQAMFKRERKRKLLRRKLLAKRRLAKIKASSISTASVAEVPTAVVQSAAPGIPFVPSAHQQGDPEDTYFALSLVGSLQRLRPQQRAMAKMNIVRYLTEMAFTDTATI